MWSIGHRYERGENGSLFDAWPSYHYYWRPKNNRILKNGQRPLHNCDAWSIYCYPRPEVFPPRAQSTALYCLSEKTAAQKLALGSLNLMDAVSSVPYAELRDSDVASGMKNNMLTCGVCWSRQYCATCERHFKDEELVLKCRRHEEEEPGLFTTSRKCCSWSISSTSAKTAPRDKSYKTGKQSKGGGNWDEARRRNEELMVKTRRRMALFSLAL